MFSYAQTYFCSHDIDGFFATHFFIKNVKKKATLHTPHWHIFLTARD